MNNYEQREKIQLLELDLSQARRSLLQSNGWKNTSATPGSYWMWKKELAIGTVFVDEDTALRIQDSLDSGIYNDMKKDSEPHFQ